MVLSNIIIFHFGFIAWAKIVLWCITIKDSKTCSQKIVILILHHFYLEESISGCASYFSLAFLWRLRWFQTTFCEAYFCFNSFFMLSLKWSITFVAFLCCGRIYKQNWSQISLPPSKLLVMLSHRCVAWRTEEMRIRQKRLLSIVMNIDMKRVLAIAFHFNNLRHSQTERQFMCKISILHVV